MMGRKKDGRRNTRVRRVVHGIDGITEAVINDEEDELEGEMMI